MIIKLEPKLSEMKIGIIGERSHLLEEILQQQNLSCVNIKSVEQIDTSFDIIFGSGVYSLIKKNHLDLPKYGFVFFHETPLPEGRGNAPLQWTLEHDKDNLTITAFKAVEAMDAGDYIYQHNIELQKTDTLKELEAKRQMGIQECLTVILSEMSQGYLVFRKQTGKKTVSTKRTPEHSELDKNLTLLQLWDKIRGCDNERFPAFFKLNNKKIVLKYEVMDIDPK